jgi:hypothetical protein
MRNTKVLDPHAELVFPPKLAAEVAGSVYE